MLQIVLELVVYNRSENYQRTLFHAVDNLRWPAVDKLNHKYVFIIYFADCPFIRTNFCEIAGAT